MIVSIEDLGAAGDTAEDGEVVYKKTQTNTLYNHMGIVSCPTSLAMAGPVLKNTLWQTFSGINFCFNGLVD